MRSEPPTAEVSDFERLSQYRSGQVEALAELVEKFKRPLYGFLMNMTERADTADEVFQEVWLRVIRHSGRIEERNFSGWLFRIAHNLVIDHWRRQRPAISLEKENEDGLTLKERLADLQPLPFERLDGEQVKRRVAEAVKHLPAEQKEVFLMRLEGDIPFKEIARIQGVSINTALARMQYALAKLRQELKQYRETSPSGPGKEAQP
ncbi:MAG: sigma-70 family RNA polymerase sigma factor [Lentisphaerae bacterium]|nr:sigma-70 family RNA polymerase sigma factor [Lentisphaerota bacterium]